MWRPVPNSLALFWLTVAMASAQDLRVAPNPSATAINQLAVSGNACGPAALLNAFRSGNDDWQRAFNAVTGKNDRERILTVIREVAMRPSPHSGGRPRWNRRGVSVADLRDMGDEMTTGHFLPRLSEEVFFRKPRETPEKLLARVHQRLETSLSKGLPPILSIRRYVLRASGGKPAEWLAIDAHFVTVTSVPRKTGGAHSFDVGYIDPWGGRRLNGTVAIPSAPVFPDADGRTACMEAVFPDTSVGTKLVRRGEKSVLVVSAAVGRW